MNWAQTSLPLQQKVLNKLKVLAAEELADDDLSNAYLCAVMELEMWLNFPFTDDIFSAWLAKHQAELEPYIGRAVVIHLDKGVIADYPAEDFWKEREHTEWNDQNTYIYLVPSPSAPEIDQPVEATDVIKDEQ